MLSASLLITIIAMILVLALGIGFWARSRRARPLVGAIGTALIPLGLFLLGITDLTINGIMSLVHWVQGTLAFQRLDGQGWAPAISRFARLVLY